MSRGIGTMHQLKGVRQNYSSFTSAKTIGKTKSSINPNFSAPFSSISSCIDEDSPFCMRTKANKLRIGRHNSYRSGGLPFFVLDLNFVRHISTVPSRLAAAGGPPPSPPGDGKDDGLVCPKCGSPCEHVNSFVAATRYVKMYWCI